MAPPMMPAATPGPQPQPWRRHCALASVAVAASVHAITAAAVSAESVFFMQISLRACRKYRPETNCLRLHHPTAISLEAPSNLYQEHKNLVGILMIPQGAHP